MWKGSTHQKASTSWPRNDVLLNVQVIHRHGDRNAISLLRNDRSKENDLWAKRVSKKYGLLQYNPSSDGSDKDVFSTKNGINLEDMFQWKHIAKKLNGSYIVHKTDNYDTESSEYILNSKSTDSETQHKLSELKTWDILYTTKHNLAYWSGQLTDQGAEDLLKLGTWLRQRYVQKLAFLAPTYSEKDSKIYTISTNFARTIQSADSLLTGLYPQQNRSNAGSIPIHTDHRETW